MFDIRKTMQRGSASFGKLVGLLALLPMLVIGGTAPVDAASSTQFRISGVVPVRCDVVLEQGATAPAPSGYVFVGMVRQTCNTPHSVVLGLGDGEGAVDFRYGALDLRAPAAGAVEIPTADRVTDKTTPLWVKVGDDSAIAVQVSVSVW